MLSVLVRRDTAPSGQTAGNCSLERENSSQGPWVGNDDVARTTVNNSHVSQKGVGLWTGDNPVKQRAMKSGASEAESNSTCKRVEISLREKVECVVAGNDSDTRKKLLQHTWQEKKYCQTHQP